MYKVLLTQSNTFYSLWGLILSLLCIIPQIQWLVALIRPHPLCAVNMYMYCVCTKVCTKLHVLCKNGYKNKLNYGTLLQIVLQNVLS